MDFSMCCNLSGIESSVHVGYVLAVQPNIFANAHSQAVGSVLSAEQPNIFENTGMPQAI